MKTIEPSNYLSSFNIGTFKNGSWSELPLLTYENASDWGPKRDPLFIVIPFTILFGAIFLIGLIGNISTCVVIARNRAMHTATNYYLFSLAISDLLLLISGLPQEMYNIWSKYPYIFGEAFCVLQGFAAETSANATVLTITAFTVERYIAICHPFLSHTMSTLSRAIKLILLIWMFAICLAIPQAISFGIVYEDVPENVAVNEDHNTCNVKRIVIPHAFLISTVLFFVTPMTLITILYILIGLQLRQSSVGPVRGGSVKLKHLVYKKALVTHTNSTQPPTFVTKDNGTTDLQLSPEDNRTNCLTPVSQTSTQHVVKMLVAVVVAFFYLLGTVSCATPFGHLWPIEFITHGGDLYCTYIHQRRSLLYVDDN
uniref:G-protein coupled receptors family 1 profile domain-containing protein n=1 Tax=Photinus pyralis TaxID=7054 RepID=A0A1Y1K175_PHOPY